MVLSLRLWDAVCFLFRYIFFLFCGFSCVDDFEVERIVFSSFQFGGTESEFVAYASERVDGLSVVGGGGGVVSLDGYEHEFVPVGVSVFEPCFIFRCACGFIIFFCHSGICVQFVFHVCEHFCDVCELIDFSGCAPGGEE